jgi:hypothetical protein
MASLGFGGVKRIFYFFRPITKVVAGTKRNIFSTKKIHVVCASYIIHSPVVVVEMQFAKTYLFYYFHFGATT